MAAYRKIPRRHRPAAVGRYAQLCITAKGRHSCREHSFPGSGHSSAVTTVWMAVAPFLPCRGPESQPSRERCVIVLARPSIEMKIAVSNF